MKKGDITTDTTEIKSILRKYYAKKLDYLKFFLCSEVIIKMTNAVKGCDSGETKYIKPVIL